MSADSHHTLPTPPCKQLLPQGSYARFNPDELGECYLWEHDLGVVRRYRETLLKEYLEAQREKVAITCSRL
jgi:hypothetical protein